ncbi:hypothetical protein LX32DRAFT_431749 [Colletotrichum zoysiae]|uniref:Uncharacterized protein n=1 Tax=Colletotrichum zoysiae TaxID=1216348 RepID=A0AAD9HFE4_9PEZI|nr:hypothetical protein LX32DRAFT_431749 [Colletotrichum zoysiae]
MCALPGGVRAACASDGRSWRCVRIYIVSRWKCHRYSLRWYPVRSFLHPRQFRLSGVGTGWASHVCVEGLLGEEQDKVVVVQAGMAWKGAAGTFPASLDACPVHHPPWPCFPLSLSPLFCVLHPPAPVRPVFGWPPRSRCEVWIRVSGVLSGSCQCSYSAAMYCTVMYCTPWVSGPLLKLRWSPEPERP